MAGTGEVHENPHFVAVVSNFVAALKRGGSLFLTVHRDTPEAEASQIDFHENTG